MYDGSEHDDNRQGCHRAKQCRRAPDADGVYQPLFFVALKTYLAIHDDV